MTAYMCDAIFRANDSVLYVLAKLDKVVFRQVVSACKNISSGSCNERILQSL